ncbi:MAG: hypothetical protein ACD_65C00202G0001 [uncultured bacterium]|nr:MAG: hypothetical protein ACD_65C00202G0001 [uncultured bacterium]
MPDNGNSRHRLIFFVCKITPFGNFALIYFYKSRTCPLYHVFFILIKRNHPLLSYYNAISGSNPRNIERGIHIIFFESRNCHTFHLRRSGTGTHIGKTGNLRLNKDCIRTISLHLCGNNRLSTMTKRKNHNYGNNANHNTKSRQKRPNLISFQGGICKHQICGETDFHRLSYKS